MTNSTTARRAAPVRFLLVIAAFALIVPATLMWFAEPSQAAADAACATSGPGVYTVTLCLTQPADGSIMTGLAPVGASVTVTGADPGTARLLFELDGVYLLTEFEAPHFFELPTYTFPNGVHTLSVAATMRDSFVTAPTQVSVTFSNAGEPPAGPTFTPRTVPAPAQGQSVMIAANSDGAGGTSNAAAVAQLMENWDPALVLYMGDIVENGTYTEFLNWFGKPGPSGTLFGRLYDITNPAVGNHEYLTLGAAGYFKYWNNIPPYYSYDAAGWHFIALNSTEESGQDNPNHPEYKAQRQWLAQDLAANDNPCTIAYFHHPVLSIGPQGDTPYLFDIWEMLDQHGVDLVLTGHDHNYQRWKRLDGGFAVHPQGMTQLVVGNGGHGIRTFVRSDDRLEIGYDNPTSAFGAVQLKLNPKGAEFRLFNIGGQLLDQGVVPCTGTAPDNGAPTTPQNLAASVAASGHVKLSWQPAWDETGVAAYAIHRNGTQVATVGSGLPDFVDTGAVYNSTYVYTVAAVDPFGNTSPKSNTSAVTLPAQGTLTLSPVADTYVEEDKTTPFGHLNHMRIRPSGPVQQGYLRFNVQGAEGHITAATLRLHSEVSTVHSFNVHAVQNTTWLEETAVFTTSGLALGAVVGNSGPVASGQWREIDVTAQVQGDGLVGFGLSAAGTAAIRVTSREGASPPQLVVSVNPPAPPPPSAPGNLQATALESGVVQLTWAAANSSNGVASYVVRRDGADLVTLGGDQLGYTDTSVAPNTTYTYVVVAVNYNGAPSPGSNSATATTPAIVVTPTPSPTTTPDVPTPTLTATPTATPDVPTPTATPTATPDVPTPTPTATPAPPVDGPTAEGARSYLPLISN